MNRNLCLLIAFIGFSLHTIAAQECPDADAILPCVCNTTNGLMLGCEHVERNEELVAVFQQDFPTKEFTYFTVSNSLLLETMNFSTNGVSFNFIYVYGPTYLNTITEDVFADSSETLVGIQVIQTQIHDDSFPFDSISGWTNLTGLTLSESRLSTVPFIESETLTVLALEGNGIFSVPTGVFSGLPRLQLLDLSFNPLRELAIATIPFNNPPSQLGLYSCFLESLVTATFYDASEDGNGGYGTLSLGRNSLTTLGAGSIPITFATTDIFLDDNSILTIERNAFYLTSIPPLNSVNMNLANNQLLTISEDAFAPIMPYIRILNLRDNTLACGCGIAWLMADPEYVAKISSDTLCVNGVNIHDLDPGYFITEC